MLSHQGKGGMLCPMTIVIVGNAIATST